MTDPDLAMATVALRQFGRAAQAAFDVMASIARSLSATDVGRRVMAHYLSGVWIFATPLWKQLPPPPPKMLP